MPENSDDRGDLQGGARFRRPDWWTRGFTQMPNIVLRNPRLSHGVKVAYALLLSYAWQADEAHPGQMLLGDHLGIGERQVRNLIRELEDLGLITTEQRGLGRTNVYWIEDPGSHEVLEALTGHQLPTRPETSNRSDRSSVSGEEDTDEQDAREQDKPTRRGRVPRADTDDAEAAGRRRKERSSRPIHAEPDDSLADTDEWREEGSDAAPGRRRQRETREAEGWSRWQTKSDPTTWNARDLTGYFIFRSRELRGPRVSIDVNREAVAKSIATWMDEGTPAETVKAMIELHMEDDLRPKLAAWKQFIADAKRLLTLAERRAKEDKIADHDDPLYERAYWEGRLEEYHAGTYRPHDETTTVDDTDEEELADGQRTTRRRRRRG